MSDYANDLKIDTEALDVEWLDQPITFMKYSELSAQADMESKRAYEHLKIVRSGLILNARSLGKTTIDGKEVKLTSADTIEAFYRTQKNYIEIKEKWIQAEYEAGMARNAVFAFNQRKVALENLVKLQGQNYFAAPQEPRDLKQLYDTKRMKEKSVSKRTQKVAADYKSGRRG